MTSRLAIVCLLAIPAARAAGAIIVTPAPAASIAFARYIASLRSPDPFQEPGFTLLTIQASVPELYKEATVVAVRRRDATGVCMYAPLQFAGDGSVLTEVVDRYFQLEREFAASPEGGKVGPGDYNFRFDGEVKTGLTSAFVFRVTPKKRNASGFTGKIWIDPGSGAAILFSGQVGRGKQTGTINVVRDVRIVDGVPVARLDHISFALPQLGRAEVVVTELPVGDAMTLPLSPATSSFDGRTFPRVDRQ